MTDLPLIYWLIAAAGLVFAIVFLRSRSNEDFEGEEVLVWREGEVAAYGTDERLRLLTLGFPSLAEAEAMARERHLASSRSYESGEDALRATSLGFSRSPDHFIEIDCFGPESFQVRAGPDAIGESREQTISGGGFVELMQVIEAYFAGPAPFEQYWSNRPDRKDT